MDENLKVIERIKKAMGARNEADLAAMLGIKPGNISNYKKKGISKKTLKKVSQKTNLPLSYFEYGIIPKPILEEVSGIIHAQNPGMKTKENINIKLLISLLISPVVEAYLRKQGLWEDFLKSFLEEFSDQ